jgi:hypothetical protein
MRPEALSIRIIDALERVINSSPVLPPHNTIRYKRPLIVLPHHCPLMCIYPVQKVFAAETAIYWDTAYAFGISWQEAKVEEVETLIADPEHNKSLLRTVAEIEDIVMNMSLGGDLGLQVERVELDDGSGREADNAYAVYPVGIDLSDPIGVEEALVEGYALTVEVDATQTRRTTI